MPKQNPQKISDAGVSTSCARVRSAFTLGSLVWLPAGLAATAILRGSGLPVEPQAWLSLIVIAPVRPAACICLQAASAPWISRRRVGGYGRARVRDGRRVSVRGTARPGGDCCICRGAKLSGLACLPACWPQTVTAGLGPEAQGLKPRRNLNERYPRGRLNRAPRRRAC